jgi:hypothetical protein
VAVIDGAQLMLFVYQNALPARGMETAGKYDLQRLFIISSLGG